MKGRVWLTVLLLVFICLASTAFAEQVVEVWKYPWPGMESIAASADDGSVWTVSYQSGTALRLAPSLDGQLQEVARVSGFPAPISIAANSADGSCWVGDFALGQVVHLAADGTELSRTGGVSDPEGLSVDPVDGSCWVADSNTKEIVHLAADGSELSRTYVYGLSGAVAAVPGTNSCWAGNCCYLYNWVFHLKDNLDGTTTILSHADGFDHPESISVDSADGTVWVADCSTYRVTQFDENPGDYSISTVSTTLMTRPASVSAVPGGGAWVVDRCAGEGGLAQHLDTEGVMDTTLADVLHANTVSVDGSDGTCWVLAWGDLLHVTPTGELQHRAPGFAEPVCVAANPNDGSSWVADCSARRVSHVTADGDVVPFSEGFGRPTLVAVDPVDGSVWVADKGIHCTYEVLYNEVIHLAADGTEISRTPICCPESLAIDPNDGSCWVTQTGPDNCGAIRVEADQAAAVAFQLCLPDPSAVAVDPNDSSVWLGLVAEPLPTATLAAVIAGDVLIHFAEDPGGGDPILMSATALPQRPNRLVVDSFDSSCLVTLGQNAEESAAGDPAALDGDRYTFPVLRVTETPSGPTPTAVAYLGGFTGPMGISISPVDRSIWVADQRQVGHMTADGTVLSRTGGYCCVASVSVDTADSSCWLAARDSGDVARLAVMPEAEFTASADSGIVPFEVSFTDLSTGHPFCWEWTFGDGATSAEQNPTHVYGLGRYTVSLTVEAAGGSDTETKVNYIYAGAIAPMANFSAAPTTGQEPLVVTFHDLSTNTPTEWLWSFGDGAASTAQNPTHEYAEAGAYTVSLLAANSQGFDTETKIDYIHVGASAPTADFAARPTTGRASLVVTFEDHSTNTPTEWLWSFGDGAASTVQNPTHEYGDAGIYTVSLLAANSHGFDTETKTDYITVEQPLTAAFSTNVTRGASPLEVHFTDKSEGGATSWLWSFGDGATSTAQNPIHFYDDPGFYTVTLLVGSEGVHASATKTGCLAVGFTDTPADFWALLEVIACAEADIVQGYWDGSYDPNDPVTRAQMATFIARALAGGDANVPTGPATPTFADVGEDNWAYKYVEYCVDQDIVVGYWNDSYHPEEVVNRGQMAVFIARTVAVPTGMEDYTPPTTATFSDVTRTNAWSWCYRYVEYVAALDPPVVLGYPDGTYRPQLDVTRDQMAVFMQRAFDLPIPSPPP